MALKKILVTGGAGYIGSHTALVLIESGYEPILIDNFSKSDRSLILGIEKITGKAVKLYQGDCADKKFLRQVFEKEVGLEGVMHFAAYKSVGESVERPVMYYQNNLNSLLTLVEVIIKEQKVNNLIFSSSCTVYGEPDSIPVDEQAPFKKPESPYGATKQMCEQILEDAARADENLKIISLRYFNPIGAHPSSLLGELPIDKPNNLVPYITQTAIGKREKLTIFGGDYDTPDGTCIRDFIHIVDLAKAHVSAIDVLMKGKAKGNYNYYNLGTGLGVSVLQLVKDFMEVTGVDLSYVIGPRRAGDVVKTYANPAKAQKELGWETEYSTKDALMHAWKWEKRLRSLNT